MSSTRTSQPSAPNNQPPKTTSQQKSNLKRDPDKQTRNNNANKNQQGLTPENLLSSDHHNDSGYETHGQQSGNVRENSSESGDSLDQKIPKRAKTANRRPENNKPNGNTSHTHKNGNTDNFGDSNLENRYELISENPEERKPGKARLKTAKTRKSANDSKHESPDLRSDVRGNVSNGNHNLEPLPNSVAGSNTSIRSRGSDSSSDKKVSFKEDLVFDSDSNGAPNNTNQQNKPSSLSNNRSPVRKPPLTNGSVTARDSKPVKNSENQQKSKIPFSARDPPVSDISREGSGNNSIDSNPSNNMADGSRYVRADDEFAMWQKMSPGNSGKDMFDTISMESTRSGRYLDRQGWSSSRDDSMYETSGRKFTKKTFRNNLGSSTTLSSTNEGDDSDDVFNVVLRVRPLNDQENSRKDRFVADFPGDGQVSVNNSGTNRNFQFNVVFEPDADQEDVFESCGIKKLVENSIAGYSCTAFAFGQTGSGKTHTMTGPPAQFHQEGVTPDPSMYGLMQRSFKYLFQLLKKQGPRIVRASYMEVYNEQVIDLLNNSHKRYLAVRWSKNRGFYVENLFTVECTEIDDVMAVLEEEKTNIKTDIDILSIVKLKMEKLILDEDEGVIMAVPKSYYYVNTSTIKGNQRFSQYNYSYVDDVTTGNGRNRLPQQRNDVHFTNVAMETKYFNNTSPRQFHTHFGDKASRDEMHIFYPDQSRNNYLSPRRRSSVVRGDLEEISQRYSILLEDGVLDKSKAFKASGSRQPSNKLIGGADDRNRKTTAHKEMNNREVFNPSYVSSNAKHGSQRGVIKHDIVTQNPNIYVTANRYETLSNNVIRSGGIDYKSKSNDIINKRQNIIKNGRHPVHQVKYNRVLFYDPDQSDNYEECVSFNEYSKDNLLQGYRKGVYYNGDIAVVSGSESQYYLDRVVSTNNARYHHAVSRKQDKSVTRHDKRMSKQLCDDNGQSQNNPPKGTDGRNKELGFKGDNLNDYRKNTSQTVHLHGDPRNPDVVRSHRSHKGEGTKMEDNVIVNNSFRPLRYYDKLVEDREVNRMEKRAGRDVTGGVDRSRYYTVVKRDGKDIEHVYDGYDVMDNGDNRGQVSYFQQTPARNHNRYDVSDPNLTHADNRQLLWGQRQEFHDKHQDHGTRFGNHDYSNQGTKKLMTYYSIVENGQVSSQEKKHFGKADERPEKEINHNDTHSSVGRDSKVRNSSKAAHRNEDHRSYLVKGSRRDIENDSVRQRIKTVDKYLVASDMNDNNSIQSATLPMKKERILSCKSDHTTTRDDEKKEYVLQRHHKRHEKNEECGSIIDSVKEIEDKNRQVIPSLPRGPNVVRGDRNVTTRESRSKGSERDKASSITSISSYRSSGVGDSLTYDGHNNTKDNKDDIVGTTTPLSVDKLTKFDSVSVTGCVQSQGSGYDYMKEGYTACCADKSTKNDCINSIRKSDISDRKCDSEIVDSFNSKEGTLRNTAVTSVHSEEILGEKKNVYSELRCEENKSEMSHSKSKRITPRELQSLSAKRQLPKFMQQAGLHSDSKMDEKATSSSNVLKIEHREREDTFNDGDYGIIDDDNYLYDGNESDEENLDVKRNSSGKTEYIIRNKTNLNENSLGCSTGKLENSSQKHQDFSDSSSEFGEEISDIYVFYVITDDGDVIGPLRFDVEDISIGLDIDSVIGQVPKDNSREKDFENKPREPQNGLRNRQTGSHGLNEFSSRSHSVLTVTIDSETQAEGGEDDNLYITKRGKLSFVDLAGSEKVKDANSTGGPGMVESNSINKSLLVLGNCISHLGDPKRRQGHIPYRDSKLTKLLADSLGGNGITLMIACITPSSSNTTETLNTLRYASRAKKIKTRPTVKMDPREKLIVTLKKEIKVLRSENHYLRQQLDFPAKPKGQLQKENDEKFMKFMKETQQKESGMYEMLQEYMVENEALRAENNEMQGIKDKTRREQQVLNRENEKLAKRVEELERVISEHPSTWAMLDHHRRTDGYSQNDLSPRGSPVNVGYFSPSGKPIRPTDMPMGSGNKVRSPVGHPKRPPHRLQDHVTRPAPRPIDYIEDGYANGYMSPRQSSLTSVKGPGSPHQVDRKSSQVSHTDVIRANNERLKKDVLQLEGEIQQHARIAHTNTQMKFIR